jgi:phage terminase large subunit-like protein
LTQRARRSASAWLALRPQAEVDAFLESLSDQALAALPYVFDVWALPHQLPPEGDWRTWVILGGRGGGGAPPRAPGGGGFLKKRASRREAVWC